MNVVLYPMVCREVVDLNANRRVSHRNISPWAAYGSHKRYATYLGGICSRKKDYFKRGVKIQCVLLPLSHPDSSFLPTLLMICPLSWLTCWAADHQLSNRCSRMPTGAHCACFHTACCDNRTLTSPRAPLDDKSEEDHLCQKQCKQFCLPYQTKNAVNVIIVIITGDQGYCLVLSPSHWITLFRDLFVLLNQYFRGIPFCLNLV